MLTQPCHPMLVRAAVVMAVLGTCAVSAKAEELTLEWARAFSGSAAIGAGATGEEGIWRMTTGPQGDIFVCGGLDGSVDFDPGPGTSEVSSGDSTAFLARLDSEGDLVWVRSFAGGISVAPDVVVDGEGNAYMTGFFAGTVDFDPGPGTFELTSSGQLDIFVVKLNEAGELVWAVALEGTNMAAGKEIDLDAANNIYVGGHFWGTVDFDPDEIDTFNLTSTTFDQRDAFVLKLNPDGEFVWAGAISGPDDVQMLALSVSTGGDVYAAGAFRDTADFNPDELDSHELTSAGGRDGFVTKWNTNGDFVWAHAIEGSSSNWPYGIALNGDDDVYTTGYFRETANFNPDGASPFELTAQGDRDIFVLKLDSDGQFVWARGMGGPGVGDGLPDRSMANDITIGANGNVYTTGWFEGVTDFDPGAGTFELTVSYDPANPIGASNHDAFVSVLNSDGEFVWAGAIGGWGDNEGRTITVNDTGSVFMAGHIIDDEHVVDLDPGPGLYEIGPFYGNFFLVNLAEPFTVSTSGTSVDASTLLPVSCAVVELTSSDETTRFVAAADETGEFFIEAIPPDTYAVRVMAPGYERLFPAPLVIETNEPVVLNYFLHPHTSPNTVTGLLTDEDTGQPLVGVLVELFIDDVLVDDTFTCVDGRYELLLPESGAKADLLDIELRFSTENYEPETVVETVDPAQGAVVDRALSRSVIGAAVIAGTVMGVTEGSPKTLPEARVTLRGPINTSMRTDEDGAYAFDTLLEGVYTVTASKDGFSSKTVQRTLESGEVRQVNLQLPSTTPVEPPPEPVPGDVNGTGTVTATDVQLVINAVLRLDVDPSHNPDVNGDGVVNAMDVQMVINIVLGIEL